MRLSPCVSSARRGRAGGEGCVVGLRLSRLQATAAITRAVVVGSVPAGQYSERQVGAVCQDWYGARGCATYRRCLCSRLIGTCCPARRSWASLSLDDSPPHSHSWASRGSSCTNATCRCFSSDDMLPWFVSFHCVLGRQSVSIIPHNRTYRKCARQSKYTRAETFLRLADCGLYGSVACRTLDDSGHRDRGTTGSLRYSATSSRRRR